MDYEPLDYKGRPRRDNSRGTIALRVLCGLGLGLVSSFLGLVLAFISRSPAMFFLPMALTLGILIFITLRDRRHGFITGFILAPFLAASGLFILLRIVCGSRGW